VQRDLPFPTVLISPWGLPSCLKPLVQHAPGGLDAIGESYKSRLSIRYGEVFFVLSLKGMMDEQRHGSFYLH